MSRPGPAWGGQPGVGRPGVGAGEPASSVSLSLDSRRPSTPFRSHFSCSSLGAPRTGRSWHVSDEAPVAFSPSRETPGSERQRNPSALSGPDERGLRRLWILLRSCSVTLIFHMRFEPRELNPWSKVTWSWSLDPNAGLLTQSPEIISERCFPTRL